MILPIKKSTLSFVVHMVNWWVCEKPFYFFFVDCTIGLVHARANFFCVKFLWEFFSSFSLASLFYGYWQYKHSNNLTTEFHKFEWFLKIVNRVIIRSVRLTQLTACSEISEIITNQRSSCRGKWCGVESLGDGVERFCWRLKLSKWGKKKRDIYLKEMTNYFRTTRLGKMTLYPINLTS